MQAQARDEVAIIWRGDEEGGPHLSGEQTQCPLHGGGGQWSRGVTIHFINPAESVNFKENQARMNYLYVGCCTLGPRPSLSSLLPPIKRSHCWSSLDSESLFFLVYLKITATGEDKG